MIYDEEYLRKVLPFLKTEYFSDSSERIIYNEITSFTETYNTTASIEAIGIRSKRGVILRMTNLRNVKLISKKLRIIARENRSSMALLTKQKSFQEKAIYRCLYWGLFQFSMVRTKTTIKAGFPRYYQDTLTFHSTTQ
jgi:replicative DNA helicase